MMLSPVTMQILMLVMGLLALLLAIWSAIRLFRAPKHERIAEALRLVLCLLMICTLILSYMTVDLCDRLNKLLETKHKNVQVERSCGMRN